MDYKCDCKALVGKYVEASIDAEITNKNVERRQSCIYLGPSGNRQGSIKCFAIATGTVVVRRIFDVLPYPEAIFKNRKLGQVRKMCHSLRKNLFFEPKKGYI